MTLNSHELYFFKDNVILTRYLFLQYPPPITDNLANNVAQRLKLKKNARHGAPLARTVTVT